VAERCRGVLAAATATAVLTDPTADDRDARAGPGVSEARSARRARERPGATARDVGRVGVRAGSARAAAAGIVTVTVLVRSLAANCIETRTPPPPPVPPPRTDAAAPPWPPPPEPP